MGYPCNHPRTAPNLHVLAGQTWQNRGMTRPVNLTRPVRCIRCGEKFTRTRGNQRRCEKCKPLAQRMPAIRAGMACRAAMGGVPACQWPGCGRALADLSGGTCPALA
jgi:hypothetical protein